MAAAPVPGINWKQVTPAERKKLAGLMAHYRKQPHPFTACVRDNTKRFGPDGAKRVCAVLKDLIEGGTGWRGKRKMSEVDTITREELRAVIEQAEAIMGSRAYAYNASQLRAPKGTSIGGRWIKILMAADTQKKGAGTNEIQVAPSDKADADALVKAGSLKKATAIIPPVVGPDGSKLSRPEPIATYEITSQGQKILATARGAEGPFRSEDNPGGFLPTTSGIRAAIQRFRTRPDDPGFERQERLERGPARTPGAPRTGYRTVGGMRLDPVGDGRWRVVGKDGAGSNVNAGPYPSAEAAESAAKRFAARKQQEAEDLGFEGRAALRAERGPVRTSGTSAVDSEAIKELDLSEIAGVIRRDWRDPNFAAAPYLDAMRSLSSLQDPYGADDGRTIALYFLSNAGTWKGPTAKVVKAELRRRLAGRRSSPSSPRASGATAQQGPARYENRGTPLPGSGSTVGSISKPGRQMGPIRDSDPARTITTSADLDARRQALAQLRDRWAELDRNLQDVIGEPAAPKARAIIDEQKAITKLVHHYHVDTRKPDAIGQPGEPYDVVVVGAGPAGLSAAIYGAAEGLDVHLVDAGSEPGGQVGMSSRVENVLGFPAGVTGAQYAEASLEQANRLGATSELGVRVTGMEFDVASDMKYLQLSDGRRLETRSVIIAGGVQARRIDLPGSDNSDFVYGDSRVIRERAKGKPVVMVGGGNSAGQAALDVAHSGSHVTILLRSGGLGKKMSRYLIKQIESHPNITIRSGSEIEECIVGADGRISAVRLRDGTLIECSVVGVFIGSGPETDWLSLVQRDKRGYVVVGDGDRGHLETNVPGVYAAGDVRSGSIHRVITAAADGAAAISLTHQHLQATARAEPVAA